MKIKLLVFLKQTIRSIIICFWKTFLDQKEVYDQTIRTFLIITGFIESLIKDKSTYLISINWCKTESLFVTDCAYNVEIKIKNF